MPTLLSSLKTSFALLVSRRASVAIWVLASLVFLVASFWAKTSWFLFDTLREDWLTGSQKIRYLKELIGVVIRSDVKNAVLTFVAAVLFGAALALYVLIVQRQRSARANVAYPLGGLVSAVLGFGCASCGTLILSFLGLGAAVSLLPFRGLEFTLLAIVLLSASIVRTARVLNVHSCPIHRSPAV